MEEIQATWVRLDSEVADAVIVAVPVRTDLYPERSKIVNWTALEAMEKTKAQIVVVILVDVDCGHWPYSGIYVIDQRC